MSHNLVRLECPHRTNPDGTIDSICPRCFATIGTSTREFELQKLEVNHVCNTLQLKFFEEIKKKPVASVRPMYSVGRLTQMRG
jgi:hypothetical protein